MDRTDVHAEKITIRKTETTKKTLYIDMERYLRSIIKWKKQVAEQYV